MQISPNCHFPNWAQGLSAIHSCPNSTFFREIASDPTQPFWGQSKTHTRAQADIRVWTYMKLKMAKSNGIGARIWFVIINEKKLVISLFCFHEVKFKNVFKNAISLKHLTRCAIACWEEFLNNRTFRVKLGDHHSSVGAVKSGVPRALCLDSFSSWYLSMTWQMNWRAIICSTQTTSSSSAQEVSNTSSGHQSVKRSISLIDGISR